MRAVIFSTLFVVALSPRAYSQDTIRLSLKEAERRAVDMHPRVRAGHYATLAAGEVVRQSRSSLFPTVFASFTGAQAQDGTRIAAGGLNNPIILDRFAAGFSASQLVTDFGRTSIQVAGQVFRTDAQAQDEVMQRAEVLLEADRAYFDALRARAVARVAQQAVATRQLVVDQVTALAASNLKSGLDVSFANVNLSQAQLLLAQAQGEVQAADASLSAALGSAEQASYELEEEPLPALPVAGRAMLIAQALNTRPDIASRRYANEAASKFAAAERALWLPSVSFISAAGFTPYHQIGLTDRYAALGVNVTVPVTNGNLYNARHAEATLRQRIEDQQLHDLENRVARDVTIALLAVQTAHQRIDLTTQLLAHASDALDLAQGRYDLGLSSIVELTQAQLNKTQAEFEQTTARYEYQSRNSILRFQIGDLK